MKTIDTIEANAYLMRGALPSVERSRDEYTGSVFGSAALALYNNNTRHRRTGYDARAFAGVIR